MLANNRKIVTATFIDCTVCMLMPLYWNIKFVRLFTVLARDKHCIYLDKPLVYVITITVNIVVSYDVKDSANGLYNFLFSIAYLWN